MKKFFLVLFLGLIGYLAWQYKTFNEYKKIFCTSLDNVSVSKDYLTKTMDNKTPYVVVKIDQNQINSILAKLEKEGTTKYKVCIKIMEKDKIKVFAYKNPILWGTLDAVPITQKPFLAVESVHFELVPLPQSVSEKANEYFKKSFDSYFGQQIPVRTIDRAEIKDHVLYLYSPLVLPNLPR